MQNQSQIKYEQIVNDKDIINIANRVANKYRNLLSPEELEQCKQLGMWKGCAKYKGGNCKLSTYICHRIRWECCNAINQNKRYKLHSCNNLDLYSSEQDNISEYTSLLNGDDELLLSKRYEENRTLKEISNETGMTINKVRRRLDKIVNTLREDLS